MSKHREVQQQSKQCGTSERLKSPSGVNENDSGPVLTSGFLVALDRSAKVGEATLHSLDARTSCHALTSTRWNPAERRVEIKRERE